MLRAAMAILLALTLSACASDIPYATLKTRYATPASRFIDLPGGITMHYRDQGNPAGPPLVLVHGFAASLYAWEPWVTRLGDAYRVISLDLPAHGLTVTPADYRVTAAGEAEAVDELVRALGVDRFAMAGNSMGGPVVWSYALAHPDKVTALAFLDSPGPSDRLGADGRKASEPMVFAIERSALGKLILRRVNPRPLAKQALRAGYGDAAVVTPELAQRYVDLALGPGHRAMLVAAEQPHATARELSAITAPTLVMHGEADVIIPVAEGKALAAAIPGAKLILYPGVGHAPMEQIPDRSAADLRAFLEAAPAPL